MYLASSTLSAFAALFASLVHADCECGYTVNSTLYTDLIESDFLHTKNITTDTDWIAQKYQVSADLARGPYGKDAQLDNVVANPLKNSYDWSGDGVNGGDAGVQLIVKGGDPGKGNLIPMAELVTNRTDIHYGSFRAGMKTTAVNGTCGAFFWYFSDSQEIDLEFLSVQQNASSSPVNLVLQSHESENQGFNAAGTPDFKVYQLPFQPEEGFHEYRFDWSPDAVKFYADGKLLNTMTENVPKSPGHITLSHWSNGDPRWSAGPPESDAILTVQYLKGYFNSSDDVRQSDWSHRCKSLSAPNATCSIPEVTTDTNSNATAHTYFFSQEKNMTVNQTVSSEKTSAAPVLRWTQATSTAVLALTFFKAVEWLL